MIGATAGAGGACGGVTVTPSDSDAQAPSDASAVEEQGSVADAGNRDGVDPCVDAGSPEACAASGARDSFGFGPCEWFDLCAGTPVSLCLYASAVGQPGACCYDSDCFAGESCGTVVSLDTWGDCGGFSNVCIPRDRADAAGFGGPDTVCRDN